MTESHALRLAQDKHDRRTCERCGESDQWADICDTNRGRLCPACFVQAVIEEETE